MKQPIWEVGDVLYTDKDTSSLPIGQVVIIMETMSNGELSEHRFYTNAETSCSLFGNTTVRQGRIFITPTSENGLKEVLGLHIYAKCKPDYVFPQLLDGYKVIGKMTLDEIKKIEMLAEQWAKIDEFRYDSQSEKRIEFAKIQKERLMAATKITEKEFEDIDMGWTYCSHCGG